MTKAIHKSKRKAVKTIAVKAKARRRACVMKPEYLAEIERFRLMDDDFMSKCLENAPECIELMLQIILGKKDLKVVKSQTEYPIKSLQGRGVRFDVFAKDSEGKEYDIEIQRADKGAEPKRARYNSALMDANALKPGEDFGKLRDTYVIIIAENDVMGEGRDHYSYQRRDDETGKRLCDGTHIIYVNGATQSMSEIGKLMHDFRCCDAKDMYFKEMKEITHHFKETEEGVEYMCRAFEETRMEGELRGRIDTAKRLIDMGDLPLEKIAVACGLTLEKVQELAGTKTA